MLLFLRLLDSRLNSNAEVAKCGAITRYHFIDKELQKEISQMKQDYSNREKILSCAQRLFFEKGYEAVGVQEIVDTAGITKPTMYYYFKSKHGLLECLLAEGTQAMLEKMKEVTETEGEFLQVFELVTRRFLELAVENKEFYLMLVSLFSSAKDNEAFRSAKPYISQFLDLFRCFFERYSKQQGLSIANADYQAMSYVGVINMFMMISFERGELESETVRRRFMKNMCAQFANTCTEEQINYYAHSSVLSYSFSE